MGILVACYESALPMLAPRPRQPQNETTVVR